MMRAENNNTPISRLELGPEAASDVTSLQPKKETDMRIAYVSSFASTADRRDMMNATLNESDYATKREAERIMNITKWNTLDVLDGKIDKMKASIAQDEKDYQDITVGRDMDSVFKLGGLFGKTTYQSEYEGIVKQKEALQELEKMRVDVAAMKSIDDLKTVRTRLGIAELPQSLVGDYDRYLAMVMKGNAERDRSLEVDWMAINGKLKEAEVVLDRWTTCLETLDTGVGIAAGLIPYGSEVYEISKALTDVTVGTKTPEQAAQEFIIGVISSHVGGKALKKMKVDEYVNGWVKKNSTYFSAKTSDALARVMGKTAAGGTQGGISGTTEGVLHGTVDVATGKTTVADAAVDTVRRGTTGIVFGGTLGGGMEGVKIRGESKRAAKLTENRNRIMALPDTPEGKIARVAEGKSVLKSREMTMQQETAIIEAHEVPRTGTDADGNPMYSKADIAEKIRILKEAGFTKLERKALIKNGVCGTIPLNTPDNVSKNTAAPEELPIKKLHAKAINRLQEIPNAKVTVTNNGGAITVSLEGDGVRGKVSCRQMPGSSVMVVESSGATKGFGPLLYDIAMEEATKNGLSLVSDRKRVSDDAFRVWEQYLKNRPDVEKVTLDPWEWFDGRQSEGLMENMTEDPATWPDKNHPIWALWTGYRKKPGISEELKAAGKLEETITKNSST